MYILIPDDDYEKSHSELNLKLQIPMPVTLHYGAAGLIIRKSDFV